MSESSELGPRQVDPSDAIPTQEERDPAPPVAEVEPVRWETPTTTESSLRILGWLSVIAWALAGGVLGVWRDSEYQASGLFFGAVCGVLVGFLCAIPFFVLKLILQYLRWIVNAVENQDRFTAAGYLEWGNSLRRIVNAVEKRNQS